MTHYSPPHSEIYISHGSNSRHFRTNKPLVCAFKRKHFSLLSTSRLTEECMSEFLRKMTDWKWKVIGRAHSLVTKNVSQGKMLHSTVYCIVWQWGMRV